MKKTTKNVTVLLACIMLSLPNVFATNTTDSGDERMKIRLKFNSANSSTRLINVLADENATAGFDAEFDAEMEDIQADDMYWLIDSGKYLTQGVNAINEDTVLALGINTNGSGMHSISIDKLENIPNTLDIFVHDKAEGIYFNLKDEAYQFNLGVGAYFNRFEIVFMQPDTLGVNDFQTNEKQLDIRFDMSSDIIKISNNSNLKIDGVEVYSILGQSVHRSNTSNTNSELTINASQMTTGTYVVIVKAENGVNTKKILVN
ncbi:T9SS type A sorting domain-containing protein [Psychroserpens sp. MEBiC05023]